MEKSLALASRNFQKIGSSANLGSKVDVVDFRFFGMVNDCPQTTSPLGLEMAPSANDTTWSLESWPMYSLELLIYFAAHGEPKWGVGYMKNCLSYKNAEKILFFREEDNRKATCLKGLSAMESKSWY